MVGFISDYDAPETVDYVTFLTAHELAHQYWAHQVAGAHMEGSEVLSETLAQYSAMMVAKRLYGADGVRRALQFQIAQRAEQRRPVVAATAKRRQPRRVRAAERGAQRRQDGMRPDLDARHRPGTPRSVLPLRPRRRNNRARQSFPRR